MGTQLSIDKVDRKMNKLLDYFLALVGLGLLALMIWYGMQIAGEGLPGYVATEPPVIQAKSAKIDEVPQTYLDVNSWPEWAKPPVSVLVVRRNPQQIYLISQSLISVEGNNVTIKDHETFENFQSLMMPYPTKKMYPCSEFNRWHHWPNGEQCKVGICEVCGKTVCVDPVNH